MSLSVQLEYAESHLVRNEKRMTRPRGGGVVSLVNNDTKKAYIYFSFRSLWGD